MAFVTAAIPTPSDQAAPQPGAGRRAALLFADVVGYSTLMAADDRRTYLRWMARLRGVVQPEIERGHGRVVQLAGDGVVAEFARAADAVATALRIQRTLKAMQQAEPDAPAMAMRIGVHVGEVFVEEEALFGSAVNLAARLQAHAVPGGIVLSAEARAEGQAALEDEPTDLGSLPLKGFVLPVRAFALQAFAQPQAAAQRRTHVLPSIAVLPLRNLTGDPAEDYFAEGVVEDVIVSLAGLHELLVIARGSTLGFAGREVDPREVGKTLGVGYVLTGSFRRAGDALRISVSLCETETGGTVWTERLEMPRGALFEAQDRLVEKVVAGIAPHVRAVELQRAMRKRPESFSAYDHMLRALHVMDSLDRETFVQARRHLDAAIAEDPAFAAPYAWAARWHRLWVGQGWSADVKADGAASEALARRAIELEPDNPLALAYLGHTRAYLAHDPEGAWPYFEQALAASPNFALAWTLSSACLCYLGRTDEAIQHAEHGARLSPADRSGYLTYHFVGMANYYAGRYEEAVRWNERAYAINQGFTSNIRGLAVSYAGAGRIEDARRLVARLKEIEPEFDLGQYQKSRLPFRVSRHVHQTIEHLRMAGAE